MTGKVFSAVVALALLDVVGLLSWGPGHGEGLPAASARPFESLTRLSQTKTVRIAIEPSAKTVAVGEVFSLTIRVDAGTQPVDAVDAYVDFNRGALRVVDSAGNEADSIVAGAALPVAVHNRADNALGQIDYTGGRQPGGGQAHSGAFTLATISFKAVASGGSSVAFSLPPSARATGAYYQGSPTSLLESATNGVVTITGATTATPGGTPGASPTSTATATPTPTATTAPSPGGGGGGGGGGGATATPPATPTPMATATPGAAAAPAALGPVEGAVISDLAPLFTWQNPPGTTQYQLQVLPAANRLTGQPDGPGIDLAIGDQALVQQARLQVEGPRLGVGNYVMLPGMTYTWRVRTSAAAVALAADDPRWGPWASRTFRTPPPSSATISPASPAPGISVDTLTPVVQWADSDARLFYYEVQVSKDAGFNTDPASATAAVLWEIRHGGQSAPLNSYAVRQQYALEPGATYYWRVRPRVQGDAPLEGVAWSASWSFRTP
ncbi:MAG: hypothetical protein HYY02_04045 [Chloroflexi bacterium]|nr:hypothetical protein [Chloroflexota bacterium]